MITSKDIIAKTGISRATLNNYIRMGILPKPVVGPPRTGDHGVKQIGYFPDEVLARLDRVKVLKGLGRSMDEIASLFQSQVEGDDDVQNVVSEKKISAPANRERTVRPYTRFTDRELKVTICDIESPAYLVNRDFEIEWVNKQAEEYIFHKGVKSLVDGKARNIFRLFFDKQLSEKASSFTDLTSLHLTVLQRQVIECGLASVCKDMSAQECEIIQDIFNSRSIFHQQQVYRLPVTVTLPGEVSKDYLVYTMSFREGTFFVYIPDEGIGNDLMALLAQRERVISDLLKHKMPTLASLCVLASDLQDSVRISAELLPGEYFELINGLWECAGPVFDRYNGVYGKHVGDGVLYYFLDNPGDNYISNCINCAIDLREVVSDFSDKWKSAKGWDNDLFLNTGINEGQEFFGTIRSADNIEFTALGDTINTAARLSEFAQNGQIWTSKNLVSKLNQEERNLLRFGVHKNNNPENRFIRDSFSRITDLVSQENQLHRHFCTIAGLPITEIKERVKPIRE